MCKLIKTLHRGFILGQIIRDEIFFIVPARDKSNLHLKISELEKMQVSFIIVCGEKVSHPKVIYRPNAGKWDAINFGAKFIPKTTRTVVLNDVDTQIFNFKHANELLNKGNDIGLVYCGVRLSEGPQVKFYKLLDPIRKIINIAASGELMLLKRQVFTRVLPLPPCIAEDSYILFKILEVGIKALFSQKTYVKTKRTINATQEEKYKNRTTLGIYQALDFARPPPQVRMFYRALPFFAPLLTLAGADGEAWAVGINKAYRDHLKHNDCKKF